MKLNRMKKELKILNDSPPPGISCWLKDEDKLDVLEASIKGPKGSPYENGTFHLSVNIPERYPIEPPIIRFITQIYHPNVKLNSKIDNGGRICLDLLNSPPKGNWKPIINLSTLLTSIQLLMAEPNADDGLMAEIVCSFFFNSRLNFTKKTKMNSRK
jgi:ubiquitin-conjugating enzyme E2 T